MKTSPILLTLLVVATSAFASSADLLIRTEGIRPYGRVDPGALVTFIFWSANAGPDAVDAHLTMAVPAGTRFVSVSDARWRCSIADDKLTCSKSMKPPVDYYDSFFEISVVVPDDPKGSITDTVAHIESDAVDPRPDSNFAPSKLTVYHTFTVTTPDDFGSGSLRSAIEQSNEQCDGALPCKIRFESAMRIAPKSPLPAISGCDVIVDGGVYDPFHFAPNRYFDKARRVEIVGDQVESGSGLAVASRCGANAGGVTLSGLAIGGFPENGIELRPENDHATIVQGCFIGTDASGTVAVPNFLRCISADAPKGSLEVNNSLLAGNRRSGIALYRLEYATISGNLIGVRFGAIPMPNGASGVYVDAGSVRFNYNAIEYNREFGLAVGPHASHMVSFGDYIILNGGLAIDWGLDGPSDGPSLPPVPRLTTAFYDAAANITVVRGVLPITPLTPNGLYVVRAILAAGDHEGGIRLGSQTDFIVTHVGDLPFELRLRGNFTGQRINAQAVRYIWPDAPESDTSEYSASIVVP